MQSSIAFIVLSGLGDIGLVSVWNCNDMRANNIGIRRACENILVSTEVKPTLFLPNLVESIVGTQILRAASLIE